MNTYGLENILSKKEKIAVATMIGVVVNSLLLVGHIGWLIEMPAIIGMFWTVTLLIVAMFIVVIFNMRLSDWIKTTEESQ
jgi:hypothetical protein